MVLLTQPVITTALHTSPTPNTNVLLILLSNTTAATARKNVPLPRSPPPGHPSLAGSSALAIGEVTGGRKTYRTVLDSFISDSKQIQIDVLVENIDWATLEKRIFSNHSLETRLVGLNIPVKTRPLTDQHTELKRLDDEIILTEVYLLENCIYRGIGNLAKVKAALMSSRTAANSIYCPPHLKAQLDLRSSDLHAEDKV
ncbi:hypothetical protein PILCRDRAFT_11785 [Piloderma croceum F 1598]|uniref:26S proteasome regulatory subunit Rpn6 N-terminal domain-containing protein n=1 Tax=Piloderma croceum (strain F 1598) TaxID=765440 RepID=A0A0C3AUU6_PILCF|nr:hypothetical protein PILCRDRAFT_11785 [Piloderma croceum F 1598]